ncbi:Asp-tRNA(Asn)/Glu-tRNA(Gln) amidotransferase subunit GatC [Aestuariirhabdus litorea]|uniref:Aspartyl/glutamyl-tRNA(Asn/Gln) amidotransferase subunit C n=1 Tax=Aestuariirhabdus litorea TaxID=2528527 RepID=A0A3P3VLT9_9GAMM|nr:Asp-tRNA(Asn)/Glu-tRNA(Gln) amidotransferase subunit GatC [Aestuariirhabdus litorea]RRJ83705.1 Asp-tRNA(Asn)/Glu-tRNA(Gln) amidotransferase subunit GatC [Aestuariirhabdus litorea]RWW96927.1 Asp-tRNA(Asn)/Glu-tRNA(Gln) amidotransferase subunit GatC [Endozoicomonadaceae bacterium GTF-13]
MALDREDVKRIAHLARLSIDESDIEKTSTTLSDILQLVDQMQAVDTAQVAPLAHPLDAVQRLRVDQVTETDQRDAYQQIAPATEAGLYLVPKVID